jgi:hypothetical protein
MNYKRTRPEGLPEGVEIGTHVKAWDEDDSDANKGILVGFDPTPEAEKFPFHVLMRNGSATWYGHISPIEAWEPKPKEVVFEVNSGWANEITPFVEFFEKCGRNAEVYRFTDEAAKAAREGKLNSGWLREHGERYE